MNKFAMAAAASALFTAQGATAQDCAAPAEAYDMTADQVAALYDCIKDAMALQYGAEGDAVGSVYRDWQVSSTRPAVAGPHGERFLQTFANDLAAPQYLKFAEEFDAMPVGSVLAKESFAVRDGVARVGPLFVMSKLEEGGAPDAGDWHYDAVQPNGKPMGISQKFCADCHLNWDHRDSVAYPLEEVRLTNR